MQLNCGRDGMTTVAHQLTVALASVALATLTACNSNPRRVNQPYIDADGAGELAMEQYDTNGDGIVAGDELEKAPGLKALLKTGDANGDGGVSAEEVAQRINKWKEQLTGVTIFSYVVTLDGKPLEGAQVVFEPETFLGDEIKAGIGDTGFGGSGGATIPKEQRPTPTSPPGMHLGLYKVKISKKNGATEIVPAKYNEATTLGIEVAGDAPAMRSGGVVYTLTTK